MKFLKLTKGFLKRLTHVCTFFFIVTIGSLSLGLLALKQTNDNGSRAFTGDDSSKVKLNWVRHYIHPDYSMNQPNDFTGDAWGNVYVTGDIGRGSFQESFITIKYDKDGEERWVKQYDGPYGLGARSYYVETDTTGNIYVVGGVGGTASYADILVVRYNPIGEVEWYGLFDSTATTWEYARDVALDDSGNVYVLGIIQDHNEDDFDCLTLKFNNHGILQWSARYDAQPDIEDQPTGIAVDNSGNVYVVDNSNFIDSGIDILLIKYDRDGNKVWVVREEEGSSSWKVKVDQFDQIYLSGSGRGALIIKYDSTGTRQWIARDTLAGGVADFTLDEDGYIYGIGEGSVEPNIDFITFKINPQGIEEWSVRYNGPDNKNDVPGGITLDDSSNIYVGGTSTVNNTAGDLLAVKYNSIGEEVWTIRYDGGYNNSDYFRGIILFNKKYIYISGLSYIDYFHSFFTTLQYEQEMIVNVKEESVAISNYKLHQNYPNPFNPETVIIYELPEQSKVKLKIYDILGREIKILVDGEKAKGIHKIKWDGKDNKGNYVGSGIYFYMLKSEVNSQYKKMVLIH